MKQQFRTIRLSKANKLRLTTINDIIEEYANQGYKMTLRQLYYQLVSRDIIPNKQSEYTKLSGILKEGRMGGEVDWDVIEDRLRKPDLPYIVKDVPEAIQETIDFYRLDRQKGQKNYLEVWVEKDAISNVLKRVTHQYGVNLLVNRGYGSVTAMHDAYKRYSGELLFEKTVTILYLGDHDPSGIDMIRDIKSRIGEMLYQQGHDIEGKFTVEPIALTMAQIEEHQPPKNPAKLTDPRAGWYIDRFGTSSWEVDALDPATLEVVVRTAIESRINLSSFNRVLRSEVADKKILQEFADDFGTR